MLVEHSASDDGSGSDLWIPIPSFPFRRSARPSVARGPATGFSPVVGLKDRRPCRSLPFAITECYTCLCLSLLSGKGRKRNPLAKNFRGKGQRQSAFCWR